MHIIQKLPLDPLLQGMEQNIFKVLANATILGSKYTLIKTLNTFGLIFENF